jgi:HEAT repeat protein
VADRDVIPTIMALLQDARARQDGWPKRLRVDEAARLAALLRTVPVLELTSIDWSLDPWSYDRTGNAQAWLRLFEKQASIPDSWAWLAISTLDRSGFVRQAAVEALGRDAPIEAAPFLVLRTSDWVLQVRTVAEALVQHHLSRLTPAALLPSLEVALQIEERLSGARATSARAVRERFQAAPDEILIVGLKKSGPRTQRWCLREIVARRSPHLADALRAAFGSSSAVLRFEAATALAHVPQEVRGLLISFALEDHVGFVRRAAVEAVPTAELNTTDLERLLLDSNRAARELAQREWHRRHGVTPAPWYRDRLTSRRVAARAAALLGLAEVGEEADAAEAVVRLDDASWRVRLMSLRCITKLAPAEAAAAALEALGDSSHKVVIAAASVAIRHPSPRMQVKAEQLIFSPDVSRRRTGLRLLRAGGVVWQAETLDKLLRSAPSLQRDALILLDKFVTRGLVGHPLPPALRDRLIEAVNASELPPFINERRPLREWNFRRRAEIQRARILFGLRSAATAE